MLRHTKNILPSARGQSMKQSSTANLLQHTLQTKKFHIQTQGAKLALTSWFKPSFSHNKRDDIMQKVWAKKQQRLSKETGAILQELAQNSVRFESAQIYIRKAGSFDNADKKAQQVHIALRGIAHTAVILKCNKNKMYLLDRVVEGIRLIELKDMNGSKFKADQMMKLSSSSEIDLCSTQIADWIQSESQRKYDALTNSCVQFAFYFYLQFCRNSTEYSMALHDSHPMMQLNDIRQ
eukprot:187473_1